MTVPHFSFFPCIWVIPCLLLPIRTCDLAVQKLLNVETFFQVPLVYSYFSTCKHRGHSECHYLQAAAAAVQDGEEGSAPSPLALQVSLGFNLALRVSGQEACNSNRMGVPAPLSQTSPKTTWCFQFSNYLVFY